MAGDACSAIDRLRVLGLDHEGVGQLAAAAPLPSIAPGHVLRGALRVRPALAEGEVRGLHLAGPRGSSGCSRAGPTRGRPARSAVLQPGLDDLRASGPPRSRLKARARWMPALISTWNMARDASGFRADGDWNDPLMPAPLPDAVVFDNDGLLLDTESVWTRAEQDLFERRGLEFTPADKRELVGTSAEIAGGVLERRLGEPGRAAELIEELNALVVAELEHGVEAMVGARELLQQLKRARHADRPRLQLAARLRAPLAGDRRLRGPLRRRPQRPRSRGAEAGARSLPGGLPPARRRARPRVVALEDSPTGVAAARAAGLTVIGVPSLEGVAARGSPPHRRVAARRRSSPTPGSRSGSRRAISVGEHLECRT